MRLESMSLLLQILVFLFELSAISALSHDPATSLRFELIHRHGPEILGRAVAPEDRLQLVMELVQSDGIRKRMIQEMLGQRWRRRRAMEMSSYGGGDAGGNLFKMRISSGAYAGTGQYFVNFRVGTPAQKFFLVADTGSDLTWMNCQYRCNDCVNSGNGRPRRKFIADNSSSFSPISCSSSACKSSLAFSLSVCPTPESLCTYDYKYADGSDAKGFFANESTTVTLSNGLNTKLKGIVIGCSSSFTGGSFEEADGVLGLGHSEHSFAARAIQKYGGKFSYCLVDHLSPRNVSNYLTFGSGPTSSNSNMTYARLVLDPKLEPFYSIDVHGISMGGKMLTIPHVLWNATTQGGVILDSGSSLTSLAEPAYRAVFEALSVPLNAFERVELEPFELCFKPSLRYTEDLMPRLAIHLNDGVRFEPHVKSYVIDVATGVKCIGLLSAPWPGISIIGNIMQQNFLWEFELGHGRLGFKPSTCTSD